MRKVNTTIKYIEPYSIAEDAGIEVGDKLISINGHDFHDILEYRYLTAEYEVTLEILKKDGTTEVITVENDYDDIGIEFEEGLIDEARQFMKQSDYPTAAQAIGYKELMPYLKGESELEPCVERLKQETRKYAKRQLTWFRRDDRIHYIKADGDKSFSQIVDEAVSYVGFVRDKSK